jgi:hypothetical protein
MNRTWIHFAVLISAMLVVNQPAQATNYSDGATHTANASGPFDLIGLSQATTLNVVAGANVLGSSSATAADPGVDIVGGSTVNVLGGSVQGGVYTGAVGTGGFGIYAHSGNILVSGGIVQGGTVTGSGYGGSGILARSSSISITGGSIQGATNPGGTFGGNGILAYDSPISISGGSLQGGNPNGYALLMYGISTATISGGTIGSGGLLSYDTTLVSLTGGSVSKFEAHNDAVIRVYGSGLSYDGVIGHSLIGHLADGSAVNAPVLLFDHAQLLILPTPEPGTLSIFGIGISCFLAFGVHQRRRARDNRI